MWASESMEIAVPVQAAYSEWSRWASFPRCVDGLVGSDQLDEAALRWASDIDSTPRTADTVIVEERPHRRIGWLSTHGPEQFGSVTFHERGGARCRVTVELDYHAEAIPAPVQDQPAFLTATIASCLLAFSVRARLRWSSRGPAPTASDVDTS